MNSLEGWLLKRKSGSDTFSAMFSKDNKRWFKVKEVKSTDSSEVALCYYKSPKDTEPRGWVYLRDVIELSDDGKIFSVISPARTMVLEAQTSAEHRFWLFGLADLCPGANTSLIKSQAPKKLTNKRVSEEKMQIDRNGRNNDESEERNARHIPNEYHEKRDDQHLKSANQSSNSVNEDADSKQSTRIARNEDSKSFRQYNNQNARNQPENREEQNIAQYNRRSNHNLNDFVSTNTVNKNNKSSENLPDSASYHSMRRINSQSVNERIDDQTMRQSETQDRKTRTTPRRKSPTNSMKQNRDHEDFEDKPTAFQSYETESTPYQERGSTSDEKSRTKAPAGPPPKRAQDLFKEEGQKRKTIDDIISSRRGSTELELSDDEFDKEFKTEQRMRAMFQNHYYGSQNLQTTKKGTNNNDNKGQMEKKSVSSKQKNVGNVAMDDDFVNTNWDNDDYETAKEKNQNTKITGENIKHAPMLKPDENWLNDNFDD